MGGGEMLPHIVVLRGIRTRWEPLKRYHTLQYYKEYGVAGSH